MYIKIKLLSDLCAATGNGFAGIADTDISFDDNGLPFVQSKRLKGCLREAGLEILNAMPEEHEEIFYSLFGRAGQSEGGLLNISDGRLNMKADGINNQTAVLDALTSLRTQTAMEEGNGFIKKTKDKSLRTARVINRGNELFFKLDGLEYDSQERIAFLQMCCKTLRGMGHGVTRGLGEIECVLVNEAYPFDESIWNSNFKIHDFGAEKCASYAITLEDSVISAPLSGGDGCESYLPGSMIFGMFAAKWVKEHPKISKPDEDEEFRNIFFKGGVKFLSAYPGNGKPFYHAPACVKKDKIGAIVHDISVDENRGVSQTISGYVDFVNVGCEIEPRAISVRQEISQHHSRPSDRGVGHATGKGADGGHLYSYKSLSSGQTFYGSIIGSEKNLKALESLCEGTVRLGRSRSAQYGNAVLSWVGDAFVSDKKVTVPPDGLVRVHVRSPLILCDDERTISPDMNLLAERLGLKTERAFCSETLIGGYNAKWLLPRQQIPAISMGSVVVMKNEGKTELTLDSEMLVGPRSSMGFGHITVEAMPDMGKMKSMKSIEPDYVKAKANNGIDLNERIQERKELEACKLTYINEKVITKETPTNSQLGRLVGVLNGKYRLINSFEELKDELRDEKPDVNPKWKDKDKRKAMQRFCELDKPQKLDWELYKVRLMAKISKVKLERRGKNVAEK